MSTPPTTQDIPHSQEAEEALLGSILVNPAAYHAVSGFLKTDDFFLLRHQYIWDALTRIQNRQEPIDYLLLIEELKRADKLGDIGGPAYLTTLINSTPTSVHAEIYGRLIERAATRRRLMMFADGVRAMATNLEVDVDKIIADVETQAYGIAQNSIVIKDATPLREVISETWDFIEERQNSATHLSGLPTGFDRLDATLGGLQNTLIVVAGRPGMGKSGFVTRIAANVANQLMQYNIANNPRRPKVVLSFNLEMIARQIALRMISSASGVPIADIMSGQTGAKGWQSMIDSMGSLKDLPLLLSPHWKLTPNKILSTVRRLNRHYDIRLITVDYIQRMRGDGRFDNRTQEIGSISRSLVEMSGYFACPIIGVAQLSRKVEERRDKRPHLDDLKESGDIEADAHAVLFLYRDDYYKGNLQSYISDLECIIAKNREGPTGMIPFEFNRQLMTFDESDGIPPPNQAKVLAQITGDDDD